MRPGKQLFPLNYNNIINNKDIKNNIKAIKLIIRETYGGNRTYINQIMFYEQNAEQVKDLICGNELNKIYKNQKKLIQDYSNNQLKNKFKINKNNSFNNIKNRCNISDINSKKDITMNNHNLNKDYLNQYNTQNIKSKKKKYNKINNNLNKKKKNEEQNIYEGEGQLMDLEGSNDDNDDEKRATFKEEENYEEEEFEENENIKVKNNYFSNNKILSDNNRNYYKIKNSKINNIKSKNHNKNKTFEITPTTKQINSAKTEIEKDKYNNNKTHQKQSLKINLNENLTPNKYLKRVKSLTNGNNNTNTNLEFNLSKNFGILLNNNEKDIQENRSNIDNNKNTFKNKIPNSTTYNYYTHNLPDIPMNINDKYQTYEERMSDIPNNFNSMYSGNEFISNSFNNSKKYIKNNIRNNIINLNKNNIDENPQMLDISDNTIINKRMNNTQENNNFNRNHLSKISNKKNMPSFITNKKSTNTSIYSQQNENQNNEIENEYELENDENYIDDKNISQTKKGKINTNNNTNNNSQRFSVRTNFDNIQTAKNNRIKLVKEKLDYLEGNIIEIKKELNFLSENLSFLNSKEFIVNNFKDQIIQICEEIYNENFGDDNNFNNFNKEKNISILSNNSNLGNQNKNNNNESLLENEINKKIDEKLGNFKDNIYEKFLGPTINEIGNSMKKNIEQLKNKVDTIGNNIYNQNNNIQDNDNDNFNFDDNYENYEDDDEYKTSSKLRNEKFDEINRIGENLYNKLLEKEKKLKLLKQEKAKYLNQENEKDNSDDNNNYNY